MLVFAEALGRAISNRVRRSFESRSCAYTGGQKVEEGGGRLWGGGLSIASCRGAGFRLRASGFSPERREGELLRLSFVFVFVRSRSRCACASWCGDPRRPGSCSRVRARARGVRARRAGMTRADPVRVRVRVRVRASALALVMCARCCCGSPCRAGSRSRSWLARASRCGALRSKRARTRVCQCAATVTVLPLATCT